MHQMARLRIGGEVQEKLSMSRRSKDIGDAFAGECATFLLHQDFERAARVRAVCSGDEANVAELRHVPQLGAVAPARRRRALSAVEFFPVLAQVSEVRVAAVGRDAKMHERIGLGADRFRHLFEFDPVVAQQRLALHLRLQLVPCRQEILGRGALGKVRREQRRVIVAQILT